MKKVLLTGGTGLIGTALANHLLLKNYEVVFLSRTENLNASIKRHCWNIENGYIDEAAFEGVDTIVHLAGAGVAKKLWTTKRKQEILESRIKSTALLYSYLNRIDHNVSSFLCANAIGIYGDRKDETLTEKSSYGQGFLAEVCMKWEAAIKPIQDIGIRTATFRIGLVLAKNGGVLPNMIFPTQFFMNPIFGNGKQIYSWIHIDDVVGIVSHLIENEQLTKNYNCTSPNPLSLAAFAKTIDKVTKKTTLKPKMPAFLLKLILGEMADIVLASSKVLPERITAAGYNFEFEVLEHALFDLLKD